MITITLAPQTPAHMAVISEALCKLLGMEIDAPVPALPVDATAPAPAVDEAPAKRTRRTKEEMAAARAEQPAAAPEVTEPEPTAPAQEPAATSITLEDVRAKLAALSQGGKTAEVKALITATGFTKLTDIPAEKYAEVLEKAAAL